MCRGSSSAKKLGFPEKIARIGRLIQGGQAMGTQKPVALKGTNLWTCPVCPDPKPEMIRMFYNPVYPIEIDKCLGCQLIWFDKGELEILQYLAENNLKRV